MVIPKHRKLQWRVMEVLWTRGALSAREVQETFPENDRPSYDSVRSIIDQLRQKKAIRQVRKVSKSQIFEAAVSRDAMRADLIDDFGDLVAGDMGSVFARLVQTGRLTLDDLKIARKIVAAEAPATN